MGDDWGKEQLGKNLLELVLANTHLNDIVQLKDLLFKVAECKTKTKVNPPPQFWNGNEVRSPENVEFESSIFVDAHQDIQGPGFEIALIGTVSSTLLMIDQDNTIHYYERVYD